MRPRPIRPGYFCGEETYFNYDKGALFGRCHRTPAFSPDKFPRDHLMDIFDSFTTPADSDASAVPAPPEVCHRDVTVMRATLFVPERMNRH